MGRSDLEQLARSFCEFCERDTSLLPQTYGRELERHFIALYRAALDLSGSPPDDDAPRISHDDWRAVYDRARDHLGESNHYWLMHDPRVEEPPGLGDLADDVADTYRDLKSGLAMIDERPADDPSWDWRFSFDTHWGLHVSGALTARLLSLEG
jgi:hypothetical protein